MKDLTDELFSFGYSGILTSMGFALLTGVVPLVWAFLICFIISFSMLILAVVLKHRAGEQL